MAVRERPRMEEPDFFSESIVRLVPRWGQRMNGTVRKRNDTAAECMSYLWHRNDALFNFYDPR
jgi:hypothetical protein